MRQSNVILKVTAGRGVPKRRSEEISRSSLLMSIARGKKLKKVEVKKVQTAIIYIVVLKSNISYIIVLLL